MEQAIAPPRIAAGETMPLARKAAADGLGTFALVFVGCGAVAVDAATGALGHVGVSAAFGLVVAVMIFATGHVSGAHFNPAVTLAFASIGRFPWREVPAYIAAQLAAATLGAAAVVAVFDGDPLSSVTAPSGALAQAAALEVLLTSFLMFVIASVATDSRASGQLAAVAIGGAVAMGALVGGPISGASMNPARSLGPALVAGAWSAQWLYVLAPSLGAVLGAWAYRLVRCGGEETGAAGCC